MTLHSDSKPSPVTWHLAHHGKPLRLLQISDSHLLEHPRQTLMGVNTERSFREVLIRFQNTEEWPPDLILVTGDLVQDPFPGAYERLFDYLENLEIPWACLPGNHDDPAMMARIMCRKEQHCAGRILSRSWQIICLNSHRYDSHGGHLSPKELEYLTGCLEETPDLFTLIALHHPPLSVGSTWMDTMRLDNGPELLDCLARFPNVKGVIFGHVHQVFESEYRSIRLWSTPSTCFQFQPKSETFALDVEAAGWRWLELYPNGQIHTWVKRLDHPPPDLDFSLAGY
ncbi:MAG: 3',5'-cyclic-AMP phosphodiesterase [Methylohalobius sp. ZOD2]